MIKLRAYQAKDLERVINLENQSFNQMDIQSFKSYYLDNELIKIIIIERDSIFLGYMIIWQDEDKSQIYSMYILEEYRRKGYALQAIKMLEESLLKDEVSLISLEVNINNHPAVLLYEKIGFEKASVRKNYYHNHDDAYLMVKDIRK
jgi:ribosomal-protein-alanine N-acetyltransferase